MKRHERRSFDYGVVIPLDRRKKVDVNIHKTDCLECNQMLEYEIKEKWPEICPMCGKKLTVVILDD